MKSPFFVRRARFGLVGSVLAAALLSSAKESKAANFTPALPAPRDGYRWGGV